ncbi:MAG: hypothetical protein ACRD6X_22640, partial [Pyrinomonadaceae bacterium]
VRNKVSGSVMDDKGESQTPYISTDGIDINRFVFAKSINSDRPPPVNATSGTGVGSTLITPVATAVNRISFSFNKEEKTYELRDGADTFSTHWSNCSDNCVYNYDSPALAKAARKIEDVADPRELDRSSQAKGIRLNQIFSLRNDRNSYLVAKLEGIKRKTQLDDTDIELTISYRIFRSLEKRGWMFNPEDYVSEGSRGTVIFDFDRNDGRYRIGSGKEAFESRWSSCSSDCIYLYETNSAILSGSKEQSVNEISPMDFERALKRKTTEERAITVRLREIVAVETPKAVVLIKVVKIKREL